MDSYIYIYIYLYIYIYMSVILKYPFLLLYICKVFMNIKNKVEVNK